MASGGGGRVAPHRLQFRRRRERFSAPVDTATVTAASFAVTAAAGDTVPGVIVEDGSLVTFQPDSVLAALTEYVVTLPTAIADTAGNGLAAAFSWRFSTGN